MCQRFSNALFLIIIISAPWIAVVHGSDLEKEKRWAQQIVDALLVGEAVDLKAGDTDFLGIYAEADEPAGRALILLHGIGAHPDWPEVINPLRSELPALGWSTLSLQMPVLPNDAQIEDYAPLFDEVAPRIDAAIDYLRKQDNRTIVLVGHSLGSVMAASYLAGNDKPRVDGFVAVGMSVLDGNERMNAAAALEKIRVPVLDIYGSRDLEGVLNSVKARAKAAREAGNDNYRQMEIEGADHFFAGSAELLTRRVYGWLKSGFEKRT